jgi:hypothetical protein
MFGYETRCSRTDTRCGIRLHPASAILMNVTNCRLKYVDNR